MVDQVVSSLWLISVIGGLFDFLTLIYVGEPFFLLSPTILHNTFLRVSDLFCFCLCDASGILVCLSVPVLYEKRQDQIDDKLSIAHGVFQAQYRKLDDMILSKIPFPKSKEKKTQ